MVTYPQHDIPHALNNYFLQKVQSIRADLDQQTLSLTSCRLTDQQPDSNIHLFHLLSEDELKAPNQNTGSPINITSPQISGWAVLDSNKHHQLFFIIWYFATDFQKAALHPNTLKNYQLVSSLSFVSKITEQIVLQQLFAYLTDTIPSVLLNLLTIFTTAPKKPFSKLKKL